MGANLAITGGAIGFVAGPAGTALGAGIGFIVGKIIGLFMGRPTWFMASIDFLYSTNCKSEDGLSTGPITASVINAT